MVPLNRELVILAITLARTNWSAILTQATTYIVLLWASWRQTLRSRPIGMPKPEGTSASQSWALVTCLEQSVFHAHVKVGRRRSKWAKSLTPLAGWHIIYMQPQGHYFLIGSSGSKRQLPGESAKRLMMPRIRTCKPSVRSLSLQFLHGRKSEESSIWHNMAWMEDNMAWMEECCLALCVTLIPCYWVSGIADVFSASRWSCIALVEIISVFTIAAGLVPLASRWSCIELLSCLSTTNVSWPKVSRTIKCRESDKKSIDMHKDIQQQQQPQQQHSAAAATCQLSALD